jgi:catechol 2,3-dioxygenase-like lactoylglutathione lyase family enzyme
MLKPTGLDHLALKVTDMDTSLAFYQHILGLELLRTSDTHAAGGRAAFLRAGNQMLDLFSRPDFVPADKHKPIGMDHLCLQLETTPINEVTEVLQQAQVEIFWGPVVRQGSTSVYIYDPDGIHIELRVDTSA